MGYIAPRHSLENHLRIQFDQQIDESKKNIGMVKP